MIRSSDETMLSNSCVVSRQPFSATQNKRSRPLVVMHINADFPFPIWFIGYIGPKASGGHESYR